MIERLCIKNFRSIEDQEIRLAPITVLYGPTSSGKSSLFYALMTLRNFVLNPNQPADALFNYGFVNLGGFDACVFHHDISREIEVGASARGASPWRYSVALSPKSATIEVKTNAPLLLQGQVPMPYPVNKSFTVPFGEGDELLNVNWNGISSSVAPAQPSADRLRLAHEIAAAVNSPPEALRRIDIAPSRRGFFKTSYTSSAVSPIPWSEDEVASLIINDHHMPAKISIDTEEIFNRDFRLSVPPGTATVFFQTTEKRKARTPGWLVNDGFGVVQVVYVLAKFYRSDIDTLLIEEPEVHLHPTVLRKFVRLLISRTLEEKKQVIFTTHSEQLMSMLLAAVADGTISADDVACYLAARDGRDTTFTPQKVESSGQVEGGLTSFIEAEIEDLQKFLTLR